VLYGAQPPCASCQCCCRTWSGLLLARQTSIVLLAGGLQQLLQAASLAGCDFEPLKELEFPHLHNGASSKYSSSIAPMCSSKQGQHSSGCNMSPLLPGLRVLSLLHANFGVINSPAISSEVQINQCHLLTASLRITHPFCCFVVTAIVSTPSCDDAFIYEPFRCICRLLLELCSMASLMVCAFANLVTVTP